MNSPVKLTDTQLVILSAASQREDRCLIVPKNLKRPAAQKLAAKLLAADLVREIKAKPTMPVWRRDEDAGRAFSLKLTAAGLKAVASGEDISQPEERVGASTGEDGSNIEGAANSALAGIEAAAGIAATAPNSAAPNAKSAAVASAPRQGTKIARVIELLQRDHGATLESLILATGWLPHTARAALTGLRHRGYDVRLDRGEKGSASVYRIDASRTTGT
jgi:Protein of unknown function (DUF3489)